MTAPAPTPLTPEEIEALVAKALNAIGTMASEGRGPRMRVPVDSERDEDVIIVTALQSAMATALSAIAERDALRARVAELEADNVRLRSTVIGTNVGSVTVDQIDIINTRGAAALFSTPHISPNGQIDLHDDAALDAGETEEG